MRTGQKKIAMFAAALIVFEAPAAGAQNSACEGGKLPYDLTAEARWKIAPREQFQLIADLSEPALYEVCRNGAIQPRFIEITTDLGLIQDTFLGSNSCVLVYSKRIGIYSDKPMAKDAAIAGTYRRIGESAHSPYEDSIRFQAQASFVDSPVNRFHVAAVTAGPPGDNVTRETSYRLCLDDGPGPLPRDNVSGLELRVDGSSLLRFPIDREPAIFSGGACVDFEGGY